MWIECVRCERLAADNVCSSSSTDRWQSRLEVALHHCFCALCRDLCFQLKVPAQSSTALSVDGTYFYRIQRHNHADGGDVYPDKQTCGHTVAEGPAGSEKHVPSSELDLDSHVFTDSRCRFPDCGYTEYEEFPFADDPDECACGYSKVEHPLA